MNGSQSPRSEYHPCPICATPVLTNARYPTAVCPACVKRAVDEHNRPLRFYNRSLSGGFQAICACTGDADTGEERVGHECWIDGVRCWADEAHLGGIVVYRL
ncbi:MAG: hypothetical protein IMY86_02680 [Chloroflexi bacterium]|nr:hypothetical protein [Chloroflexota bacterium]